MGTSLPQEQVEGEEISRCSLGWVTEGEEEEEEVLVLVREGREGGWLQLGIVLAPLFRRVAKDEGAESF